MQGVSPVPAQMWRGRARSRRRCGRAEPGPGADVGGLRPVSAHMWERGARPVPAQTWEREASPPAWTWRASTRRGSAQSRAALRRPSSAAPVYAQTHARTHTHTHTHTRTHTYIFIHMYMHGFTQLCSGRPRRVDRQLRQQSKRAERRVAPRAACRQTRNAMPCHAMLACTMQH